MSTRPNILWNRFEKTLAHVGFWGDELSGLWAAERVAILRVMKADVIG
jgi:hypothetical protein